MRSSLPNDIVIFDLETTGLSSEKDAIIEIGAIKIIDGVLQEKLSFETLVRPTNTMGQTIKIHPASYRVHGITDEMVQNAPTIDEVFPKFLSFVDTLPVAAHNISFDGRFMRSNAARLGLHWQPSEWCTVQLSKKVFPRERTHNLDALIARLGISFVGNRHRSLADVQATAQAYLLLKDRLMSLD